jgi:DNA-binding IclR family transcriptional regulator
MLKRENNSDLRKYITSHGRASNVSTSLHRSSNILMCLSNDINTITDIAGYCKYSTSTVHRLLRSLKELNWIIQDGDSHKYYLGPLILQLASNRIASHKYLIMQALGEMERLANITEETINLAIMLQLNYSIIHAIPSKHDLRIIEENKRIGPMYTGATAKVMLSQLSDEELQITLRHIKFDRFTEKTVTDKTVLLEQVEEIRRKGYCVTYGERINGAVCISAPVRNYLCPATLSVVGPEDRLKARVEEVVEELKASAGSISLDITDALKEKGVIYG